MIQSPTHPRLSARISRIGTAFALLLVVSGCAATANTANNTEVKPPASAGTEQEGSTRSDNTSGDSQKNNPAKPDTVFQLILGAEIFDFSPVFCMLGDEDILAHGPGRNTETQQVAYLDVDITTIDSHKYGEVRIDLGVEEQFSSSDEFIVSFINSEENYLIAYEGNQVQITSVFYQEDTASLGEGTLVINCT